jgi:hypothetical protein
MDDNEKMTEEEILKASQAYITFMQRFCEYVREMEPDLYSRASQFALDFTKIDGVTIELVDINEDEDDTDAEHKNGAD